MRRGKHIDWCGLLVVLVTMTLPLSAIAEESYDDLQAKIEALEEQLQELKQAFEQSRTESVSEEDVSELKQDVAKKMTSLRTDVASAAEWKEPNTLIHMAGYADVGYVDGENSDSSFNVGTFSPIFHYQYRDIVLLESELEFEVEDDGSTEIALEYLAIDYFLNDYVTIQGGKFLSSIGQFRQNLHPSWINKMASAPIGFGHDGAAPVSDVGFQIRGGFPVGNSFANYALFATNGPELIATEEDEEFELEGIEAEGFGSDADGEKVFGGRFGFLPFPSLEIGVSAATGKAAVTSIEGGHSEEGEHAEEAVELGVQPERDYEVFGFDFVWSYNDFVLRGEYVRSEIGSDSVGVTASEGATWKTLYTQASYRIPKTNWEPVVRYGDFDSPHSSEDREQLAVGLNYVFTPSLIGKVNYEFNDGQPGRSANSNRWLIQLAYGF